jgi:integrase
LAVVTIPLPNGRRKDVLLGRYGSDESKAEYRRVTAALDATAGPRASGRSGDVTVNEVLLAYLRHVDDYYRRLDGTATSEPREYRLALRPVKELFGHIPAGEFGPLALKTVRENMIRAGLCRSLVNQRIGRVKRCFKWAASEQIVPIAIFTGLTTVVGLQRGRTAARETEPIQPVSEDIVRATLPHLTRHVAGLVRFQLLTGCRPGEACSLRRCDLDLSGRVWYYRPAHHKLAYRGHSRVVAVGPKAQKVLNEFPTFDPTAYVFDLAAAVREFHAACSDLRKTPLYPSHAERNAAKWVKVGKRPPGRRYKTQAYYTAVRRAAKRAGVESWHPNQLRHTFASRVRKQYGLEAAQVTLGHARADVTQVYAERNMALAADVAEKVG